MLRYAGSGASSALREYAIESEDLVQLHAAAPVDLPDRESVLLAAADVVFTGGYQLYKRKSRLHGNVHFYGCGVDADHYARARDATTVVPDDIRDLPHPVAGYFGVIDERLDYGLIERVADAFSGGSVVMIGPTAKIDPAQLPRRVNLHWLGQRSYDDSYENRGFDDSRERDYSSRGYQQDQGMSGRRDQGNYESGYERTGGSGGSRSYDTDFYGSRGSGNYDSEYGSDYGSQYGSDYGQSGSGTSYTGGQSRSQRGYGYGNNPSSSGSRARSKALAAGELNRRCALSSERSSDCF